MATCVPSAKANGCGALLSRAVPALELLGVHAFVCPSCSPASGIWNPVSVVSKNIVVLSLAFILVTGDIYSRLEGLGT